MKKTAILFVVSILIACTDSKEPSIYTSYQGSWKCDESSSIAGTKSYVVIVDSIPSDSTKYMFRNFFNAGDNQMIILQNIDSTFIKDALQQPTSGQIIRTFNGTCSPFTKIKLNYTIFDGEKDVFFETIYTRN